MNWSFSLDVALFRFINLTLSNPLLDRLLPLFSWNVFFVPLVMVAVVALIWKGGTRGRVFVFVLLLVLAFNDGVICNSLKHAIGRARPFNFVQDAHVLVGRGGSGSMPSSHVSNWFAAAATAFLFYRRSLWFMLPLALTVGFSRVYLGVHYPSDVLVGALLGIVCGLAIPRSLDWLWTNLGQRWFPLWWTKLPSLLNPRQGEALSSDPPVGSTVRNLPSSIPASRSDIDQHWYRLGCLFIVTLFLVRLRYLASGTIELSGDEAYQWLWSKHLALSYFSKPPLIAYTQFLGTTLWGDTEFGVRFFAAFIAAIISFMVLRFMAREVNARAAFWLLPIVAATPLLAVGATLMTIDPLSVLFWTAAMLSGWSAIQRDSTRHWLWTGLWTGLGFLSKYTALFQLLSWAVVFLISPPARKQLRRAGPYWALLIAAICSVPVLVWNSQNDWITVRHLSDRGGLEEAWRPTLRFFFDFVGAEFLLLNPIFSVSIVWAAIRVVRQERQNPLLIYFLSMGAPIFLFYLLFTFRSRVLPNWIAPAVMPLFCMMITYWEARWRDGARSLKKWLIIGVTLGGTVVVLLHNTDLIGKLLGQPLPGDKDPLRRVRGWTEMAAAVGLARNELLKEGKPVFIIGDHYRTVGVVSFYLPEAKASVSQQPLVYYQSSPHPDNQFYFWPGYNTRRGENAIFVQEVEAPQPAPSQLHQEFQSITDLGMRDVSHRGIVFRHVQLFQCRNLR